MIAAFGKALQATRKRRGLSQEQLATTTGLHRTHISLLERGLREPSLDTLVKLCRAIEVSPAEAITWYVPGPRALTHEATVAATHADEPPGGASVRLLVPVDGPLSSKREARHTGKGGR
jgi:transcriptional regulator with XRE-family HTH domain